jgi:hypothetical protein
MQVRSPMLVSVGMYLQLETTFAIFIGGVIKGIVDYVSARKQHNEGQKARIENVGILLAAGLIAGEALIGLLFAALAVPEPPIKFDKWFPDMFSFLPLKFYVSLLVFIAVGWILVRIPINNAGQPDDPAPPSAAF